MKARRSQVKASPYRGIADTFTQVSFDLRVSGGQPRRHDGSLHELEGGIEALGRGQVDSSRHGPRRLRQVQPLKGRLAENILNVLFV